MDQGFTVFVVSWVNPDESLAGKGFEDYMREGVLEATDAVLKITEQPQTNALGYCVGGTLLASALAYMAATGDERIRSATFLAAQTDFSKAGDLLVFIDDEQLKALDEVMAKHGFLDGARMSAVFNSLRPKDLVWPYIVNNYLLGKQPFPFDLLYWNADSTRMPPANHSFYLREFYRYNKLSQGLLKLGGVTLDLGRVTMPIYELAAKEDHIAPAQSVLIGSKLFGGPVRYVLAGSGHIAGVINPPAKPKYMHWILEDGDVKPLATVEAFIAKATEFAGSWWPDYKKWLGSLSGATGAPARSWRRPVQAHRGRPRLLREGVMGRVPPTLPFPAECRNSRGGINVCLGSHAPPVGAAYPAANPRNAPSARKAKILRICTSWPASNSISRAGAAIQR